jgi:hypothetical protein
MEFAQAILFVFRVSVLVGACAATATFAIAFVCRQMKWSPINITVNVNNYGDVQGTFDHVGSPSQQKGKTP